MSPFFWSKVCNKIIWSIAFKLNKIEYEQSNVPVYNIEFCMNDNNIRWWRNPWGQIKECRIIMINHCLICSSLLCEGIFTEKVVVALYSRIFKVNKYSSITIKWSNSWMILERYIHRKFLYKLLFLFNMSFHLNHQSLFMSRD